MSDADPRPIAPEPEILLCDPATSGSSEAAAVDGYRVRWRPAGGPPVVARRVPDLVLMDVLMPELNGFETSRQIHSIEGAAAVPIIFISGLDTPRSKVEAFTSGGVDYITKPFEPAEVRARVANHLRLRGLQRRLEGRNRDLEEANARLESLQRMQESLTNLVVHDLRSPLTGVVTALELLDEDLPTNAEMQREELNLARTAAASMTDLVNDLLGVSKLEAAEMPLQFEVHPFPAIWAEVVDALGGLAAHQRVVFYGEGPLAVECDAGLRRILINLVHNGLGQPRTGPRVVRARSAGGRLRVEVSTPGPASRRSTGDASSRSLAGRCPPGLAAPDAPGADLLQARRRSARRPDRAHQRGRRRDHLLVLPAAAAGRGAPDPPGSPPVGARVAPAEGRPCPLPGARVPGDARGWGSSGPDRPCYGRRQGVRMAVDGFTTRGAG